MVMATLVLVKIDQGATTRVFHLQLFLRVSSVLLVPQKAIWPMLAPPGENACNTGYCRVYNWLQCDVVSEFYWLEVGRVRPTSIVY